MTKARDLANAGTALTSVSATELGYVDGVTSAIQTQIDSKEPTLPSQTGNSGKYLTTNGTTKSWGTVSQYSLPSQTGNSGKFLTTNGTSESWGTVNQPITWTQRKEAVNEALFEFAYNGSNLYVAVGATGTLFTSPDALTWTSRTSGFGTNQINSVAYGGGIFVAVGQNGTITTSTDGATWTARTSNVSTNRLNRVRYLNGNFVAVGVGANGGTGGITTSSDGITWTKRNTPTTASPELRDVAFGNTYYVAVGDNNTVAGYYSTNLSTWTVMPASFNVNSNTIIYTGSSWFSFGSSSTSRYIMSTNPTGTWTAMSGITSYAYDQTSLYQVYNSNIYSPNVAISAGSTHIVSAALSVSAANYQNYSNLNAIELPITGFNLGTAPTAACPITGMYIDSSGRIIIGDARGRILTSF